MRPSALFQIACLLAGLLVLPLAGCIVQRSPETRYYVLALPHGSGQAAGTRAITGPRVGIGPISLPAYLNRQQIFIRQGNATDVRLADYDRWGEDMAEGIARLLVGAISAQLADTGGIAQPLRAANPPDQRIGVNVNRFDGAPGAEVVLDADWGLYTPQGDVLREGYFLAGIQAATDIDGLVRAHGELLAQFGNILAEAIRSVPPQKPARR
ncbi:MAG: PqiC family protein [Deltaproteobacteria bacterium]|jgi:uncharacterized lipoprotein YmbA|nr:PqiC family protein [Deltaproteobacteria bacterium]